VQPGAFETNISNSRVSPDDERVLAGYADLMPHANAVFTGLSETAATRDSRDVAEAIFALAQQAAGTRPLRTPVPNDPGIAAFNDAVAPIQRDMLAAFGLDELLPKAAV